MEAEMTEKRGEAYFDLSYELLAEVLGLPAGSEITYVFTPEPEAWKFAPPPAYCRVRVEHPDLPPVAPGYMPKIIQPTYTEVGEAPRDRAWLAFDWNLEGGQ